MSEAVGMVGEDGIDFYGLLGSALKVVSFYYYCRSRRWSSAEDNLKGRMKRRVGVGERELGRVVREKGEQHGQGVAGAN